MEKNERTISPTTVETVTDLVLPDEDTNRLSESPNSMSPTEDLVYSVFSKREKWAIVTMAGIAALFSPLTANIYLPAIPAIATAFGKSVELINLTVTLYMVFQGIAPMFWGPTADRYGRRTTFLACLLVLSLACIGIALTPTSAYWLLMLLRCFQAAGSASTIALGAGAIVDIATPAERGGLLGLFTLAPMAGPCIGPVIGGALAQSLGWRSIFWFLTISTGMCLVFLVLFLPETLRNIVGNGSVLPPKLYRAIVPVIGRGKRIEGLHVQKNAKKPALNPFLLFTHPDVWVILVFNAVIYSVFYGVTTTISILFGPTYNLSETGIGLCFLAIGGGLGVGSWSTGRLLDWDYQVIKRGLLQNLQQSAEKGEEVTIKDHEFPIVKARLRYVPVYVAIFVASCVGYGWSLERKASIAVPLVLQVIIGYCAMGVMNTTQTLIMDLFPSHGSSITAANNLVRCSFGAGLVSVVDLIINAVGVGWTFVILAAACVLVTPLLFLELRMGSVWRERRRLKETGRHTHGA